jgi:hypothetical protein
LVRFEAFTTSRYEVGNRYQHVVEDAAVVPADESRPHLAELECRDVVRQQPVEQATGVRSGESQTSHMSDVKQPGASPDGVMLVRDRRVLDRHVPAGEVDEPGAVGGVPIVEDRGVHEGGSRDWGIGNRDVSGFSWLHSVGSHFAIHCRGHFYSLFPTHYSLLLE